MIVNPFDFVTVKNVCNTESIGMVQYLRTFVADADSSNVPPKSRLNVRAGIMARAVVMATATTNTANTKKSKPERTINLPVGFEKPVRFASSEEIKTALGIPHMTEPIPAGIIENSNGLSVPISLDISYLLGLIQHMLMHQGFQGIQKHLILCFFCNPYIKNLKETNMY